MPSPVSEPSERPGLRRLDRLPQIRDLLLLEPFKRRDLLVGQRVDVADVLREPALGELDDRLVAEALDVERAAPGEVEDPLDALRWAVDARCSTRRPRLPRGRSRCRTTGSGRASSTSSGPCGRRSGTGPTTSGITSPARRTITKSPGRTSLRATSSTLWSVAVVTVTPPTCTGSSTAYGVAAPVRPMWIAMSLSFVVCSSGGYLYAIAQRGAFDV